MDIKKIFGNSLWQIGEKILTMIFTVVVTSIIARYLGPQEYGVVNYIISVVSLFTAFSTFGMQEILIKDFVKKEEERNVILGTSFIIRLVGGVILIAISQITLYILNGDNIRYQILGIIMGACMLFKSFEVIEYYFQSQMKLKISSIIRFTTTVVVAISRILIVVFNTGAIGFIFTYLIDAIVAGTLFLIFYKKKVSDERWKFNKNYAKKIFQRCWYVAVAGLLGTIYMRIDQIMLGKMLIDTTENGIYSAAVKIAEMWYFVPTAINASFQPNITEYKQTKSDKEYNGQVQKLYDVVAIIGMFFGIAITIFGGLIVYILYGTEYAEATKVLKISVWAGLFATLGSARVIWLINENLQKYSIVYTITGALVNIALNYIMIPRLGAVGAAITTLISQFVANILILLLFKDTRKSSIMLLKAIFLVEPIRNIKNKMLGEKNG